MDPVVIPLADLSATQQLARWLAPLLRRGDVVGLQGPLGAGKTAFARYLLQALGIIEVVPSPTFTLLQTYQASQFPVYHFDLYRLEDASELEELGWDDALGDGFTLVEWPEQAAGHLPDDRLILHFEMDEKGARQLALEPGGNWIERAKDLPR